MRIRNLVTACAAVGLVAVAASPAHAAYVVLDGWELETTSGNTTNIGRLNLVSGTAQVEQEVDLGGNVFVGARFIESGSIFSLSYTPENVVGAGDIGSPTLLHTLLTISFTDVVGSVTALNAGGGFQYSFDSGSFTIATSDGDSVFGSIVGIGGNAATTNIIGGINGDSTILASIMGTSAGLLNFRDSLGTLLNPGFATGEFLFEAVTNNNLTTPVASIVPGACSFDAQAACLSFSVASAGDAYILQQVPEPATLSLLGLGLIGIGAATRRRRSI